MSRSYHCDKECASLLDAITLGMPSLAVVYILLLLLIFILVIHKMALPRIEDHTASKNTRNSLDTNILRAGVVIVCSAVLGALIALSQQFFSNT